MNIAYLGWHVPAAYELALRSSGWHEVEHACFLVTSLLFWWTVVQPWPSRAHWSRWAVVPYLVSADLANTALSAFLAFSNRALYPTYTAAPRIFGLSAMQDQAGAGAFMWVVGSAIYLVPAVGVTMSLLSRRRPRHALVQIGGAPAAGRVRTVQQFDLLRIPVIGALLRARYGRQLLQAVSLLVMCIVIAHGFIGHPMAAMNLAGVLPWNIVRALGVLALLFVGNLFCMACPFTLPRELGRRFGWARFRWPQWLRVKWIGVGLMVVFFFGYERFALWNSPARTAWLLIAYVGAAFLVDTFFRGASFCKYVCPIGQFNFLQSLISPFEIKVRDPAVCASCRTKDCIRGRSDIPGCELHLYQPRKSSNMDCTFCLDCIHACPHDNIGVLASNPGAELWHDPQRSGIGRFSRRLDLAALSVILVFGAFVNAAWMTGPAVDWQERISTAAGLRSPVIATTILFLIALVVLPLLTVSSAATISRRWGRLTQGWVAIATRYSFALVPLGFGMWLAHCSFHFLTSYDTLAPTGQRFVADLGWKYWGEPEWTCACCIPTASWLLRLEIVFLDLGLLLSLYSGQRIALAQTPRLTQALRAFAPWAVLMLVLFALGMWIVFQPMQMRGTMPMVR
jgi:ferredoxin